MEYFKDDLLKDLSISTKTLNGKFVKSLLEEVYIFLDSTLNKKDFIKRYQDLSNVINKDALNKILLYKYDHYKDNYNKLSTGTKDVADKFISLYDFLCVQDFFTQPKKKSFIKKLLHL